MYSLQVVGKEDNEVATHYSVEVHVCMCALLWVGGLQIVGSRSELAAQAEVQVHAGIVVDAFATCFGHEKRSGSAVAAQVEVHV